MHAPQIIWIVLMALGFGIAAAKHGQFKTGADAKYNAVNYGINVVATALLLWWGGFFG